MIKRVGAMASGVLLLSLISLAVSPASLLAAPHVIQVHQGDSIQGAIDAALPGTTIMVGPGTYHENLQITTDGITLRGSGPNQTYLVPPDGNQDTLCSDVIAGLGEPGVFSGICIIGDVSISGDEESGITTTVNDPVSGVRVSGFNIHGFAGPGIMMLGAADSFIQRNVAWDNDDYGIAAFVSSGDHFVANTTYENGEAGLYIGDSPDADATVVGNVSFDNEGSGIFVRNAAHGRVAGNVLYGNCIGIWFFNFGLFVPVDQASASHWDVRGNLMYDNTNGCPESEEGPALSGLGTLILGGHDISLKGNTILNNETSEPTFVQGGVVVLSATEIVGTTDSTDITVMGNRVLGNNPDLFWDGTGTGIHFKANNCETSVPPGLCD